MSDGIEQDIVYRDQDRFSYQELRARIARLANALAALGVARGSTVAFMDWNSHRFLEAAFAVPMMGAVLHAVNHQLEPSELVAALARSQATLLIAHADFAPVVDRLRAELPQLRHCIIIEEGLARITAEGLLGYEALVQGQADLFPFHEFDENTPALSFGARSANGAIQVRRFTHRQIVLHAQAALGVLASGADRPGLRQGDVYMPLTALCHAHAWSLPYVATSLGVKQVYPGRQQALMLAQWIRNEGVTFSHGTSAAVDGVLCTPNPGAAVLRGWQVLMDGARHFRQGPALGHVACSPAWLDQDLAQAPEAIRLWLGGCFHMQDLSEVARRLALDRTTLEEDGLEAAGERVSFRLLETLIARHSLVDEVAVVAVSDGAHGQRPLAVVVPKTGDTSSLENSLQNYLHAYVSSGLLPWSAVPKRVQVAQTLARTAAGKVDRDALARALNALNRAGLLI